MTNTAMQQVGLRSPIIDCPSACLFDMGDDTACLSFTNPMMGIEPETLSFIDTALERVARDFKGMVIANDNGHFSTGLNLRVVIEAARKKDFPAISAFIKHGQQIMLRLKYAPFPVVAAVSGMAVGGGCEMALHADAVQQHDNAVMEITNTGLGLVPAWGGCTAMLFRAIRETDTPHKVMHAVFSIFETIAFTRHTHFTPTANKNINHLLYNAKNLCLSLGKNYNPPIQRTLHLPGSMIKTTLGMSLYGLKRHGRITAYDEKILCHLINIVSGNNADMGVSISEKQLLDLEHNAFIQLIKLDKTQERIAYTLKTGDYLRN